MAGSGLDVLHSSHKRNPLLSIQLTNVSIQYSPPLLGRQILNQTCMFSKRTHRKKKVMHNSLFSLTIYIFQSFQEYGVHFTVCYMWVSSFFFSSFQVFCVKWQWERCVFSVGWEPHGGHTGRGGTGGRLRGTGQRCSTGLCNCKCYWPGGSGILGIETLGNGHPLQTINSSFSCSFLSKT